MDAFSTLIYITWIQYTYNIFASETYLYIQPMGKNNRVLPTCLYINNITWQSDVSRPRVNYLLKTHIQLSVFIFLFCVGHNGSDCFQNYIWTGYDCYMRTLQPISFPSLIKYIILLGALSQIINEGRFNLTFVLLTSHYYSKLTF